jgi:hypothetical protein|tara:strand:+ start:89 stop:661 length:573 start_codon:yes stop_codon:yes gene_type:complete
MASGRFGAFVFISILLLSSAAPLVSAHGANTIWIIARGTYLQPDSVEVVQNDTVEIHNSAELNRTVRVDFDGDGLYNGTNDVYCNLNSSEYCSFWLDPANWSAGLWDVEIIEENGTTMYARITIQADIHVTGNPLGYQFGMDDDDEMEVGTADSSQNWLQMIAVISGLTGILLLITLMNNRNGSVWTEEE